MDPSVGRDESTMRRKKALTCDAFLASLNAITMDGEIVNVDGTEIALQLSLLARTKSFSLPASIKS